MVSTPTLVSIEYDGQTYISLTEGDRNWTDCECDFTLKNANNPTILKVFEKNKNPDNATVIKLKSLIDFQAFDEYIHEVISIVEEHEAEISNETLALCNDLKSSHSQINDYNDLNTKSEFPNCETIHGLLKSLTDSFSESSKKTNIDYYWGIWRNDETDILTKGYDNNHFLRSYHLPDTSERRAEYKTPPPNLKWPIITVQQKNKTYFLAKASVQEIAQTSFVPHLPPVIEPEDSAERVLHRSSKSNQWQRNADRKRIKKIQDFIEFDDNLIANTPMLFIARQECISITDNFLEVHFDKFLQFDNDLYVDRKRTGMDSNNNVSYEDYRPFWIIDGQHRIHGMNNSNKKTEELGIIIFDEQFNVSETAKIFAEINTLQQKLPLLHEIFMAHRFKLSNNNPNRTFKDFTAVSYDEAKLNGWGQEWHNSRANTYSYEIAALLCSSGTLKGQLQFLPQNPSKSYMYSADQWIIYTRRWFTSNGIYNTDNEALIKSKFGKNVNYAQFIFTEVNSFFQALSQTYRKERYPDNKSRWSNPSSNYKPLLTKKSFFAILLELYPRINRRARILSKKTSDKQLTVDNFIEALKPISNVDWLDKDINSFYRGGGEKPRRALQPWISDAIAYGQRSSHEEIMNPSNKSKPGKGILSPLGKPQVQITSSGIYKIGDSIRLEVKRPYNAKYEGLLTLYNSQGEEIKNQKVSHNSELNHTAQIVIKIKEEFNILSKIRVRIEYFNAHNTVSGYWTKDFSVETN